MVCSKRQIGFGMRWDGHPLREVMDWIPKGRTQGSTRIWEMQAAALEGKTADEWYKLPLMERENKVIIVVGPGWLNTLETLYVTK